MPSTLGGLVDGQPAEEPQLDQPRLTRIERRQLVERVVERDEVGTARLDPGIDDRSATR